MISVTFIGVFGFFFQLDYNYVLKTRKIFCENSSNIMDS
ncbi:hypothetical protein SAMN05444338_12419 [Flavobacterium degerlachei]|uniref:Uncharacterized protein n=1 Tax=Flavobacterium degerlachei TaxID=229203 RepID=A0A1H3GM19_9FLAO|nr:hypothetical protein SAMN05444338_12419 [Flavobacterium degerlachei]